MRIFITVVIDVGVCMITTLTSGRLWGLGRAWPGCPPRHFWPGPGQGAHSVFSKRVWVGPAQNLAGPGLANRTHCWRFRWGLGWVHDVKPGQALGWPHRGGFWAPHAKPRQVLGWLVGPSWGEVTLTTCRSRSCTIKVGWC